MQITEKDLFLFIWDPIKVTVEKYLYLDAYHTKFKNELELLMQLRKEQFNKVDRKVIDKILRKINSYNRKDLFSETEDV